MPMRKRPIVIRFCATEEEKALLDKRLTESNFTTYQSFFAAMIHDSQGKSVTTPDLSDLVEIRRLMNTAARNINQMAKRANEVRNIHEEHIRDLERTVKDMVLLTQRALDTVRNRITS